MPDETRADPTEQYMRHVYGVSGLEWLREEQKTKLLPQAEKKMERLQGKMEDLALEITTVQRAINDIKEGRITDWTPRKKREAEAVRGGAA